MATSSVTIVLPHGRRFTIKVTPNTSIQQLLEEACAKANFNPEETDLVHQKKVIDTSLTVRFANLPNNVSLELQTSKNGPKIEKLVTVGLQLESGERVLHDFPSSTSLWDVIEHWSKIRGEDFGHGGDNTEGVPICIYMRKEIVGQEELMSNTLKKLGVSSGKVMIRLVYRIPSSLKEQAFVEDINLKRTQLDVVPVVSQPQQKMETSVKNVNNVSETLLLTTLSKMESEDTQPTLKEPKNEQIPYLPRNTEIFEEPLSNQMDFEDGLPNEEECEDELIYIGEREALLFTMEDAPKLPSIDLPDEFFQHTERDVKFLYSDLKKQIQMLEDKPLMLASKSTELVQNQSLLYESAIIRVHFPNRYVLQAKFEPKDKVSIVKGFLQQFLADPNSDFYLYTTPPKKVLDSESHLFQEGLVPAAVVHFGSNSANVSDFLKEDVKKNVSSLRAATHKATKLRTQRKSLDENPDIVTSPQTSVAATSGVSSLKRDPSGLANVNQHRPVTKNPPKWFKLGPK